MDNNYSRTPFYERLATNPKSYLLLGILTATAAVCANPYSSKQFERAVDDVQTQILVVQRSADGVIEACDDVQEATARALRHLENVGVTLDSLEATISKMKVPPSG